MPPYTSQWSLGVEEGAPRAMLTDNGSEFKNKTLRDLMEALEVKKQVQ